MKIRRRMVLAGTGGAVLALPFLESFLPRRVSAQDESVPPFAIFFRQANGVQTEQDNEPERFWPKNLGALTADNVSGRALDELTDHLPHLLVVGGVNMYNFDYDDGHARGALQGLTAQGPTVPGAGGDSEAAGESIDHRIGAELNEDGRDSLFLYAGPDGGWLGGACISYRGPANRRSALADPMTAYQTIMGFDAGTGPGQEIGLRQKSVNDLVREQMQTLLNNPKLSSDDRRRLDLHMQSIRDLETSLACNFADDEVMMLEGMSPGYESDDGDEILAAIHAHMHISALAVACGYTRSVAIQLGSGNDGSTRFRDPDTGQMMENFHYISHRRMSHDSSGEPIPNADILHHKVDRQFAQAFKYLLDRLTEYDMPNGKKLLDCGVAVWYNDNGTGPGHSADRIPFVLGGSANGFFKQGMYIATNDPDEANHAKMLNTIGSAVGVRNAAGEYLDDFGDPMLPKGILSELLA